MIKKTFIFLHLFLIATNVAYPLENTSIASHNICNEKVLRTEDTGYLGPYIQYNFGNICVIYFFQADTYDAILGPELLNRLKLDKNNRSKYVEFLKSLYSELAEKWSAQQVERCN